MNSSSLKEESPLRKKSGRSAAPSLKHAHRSYYASERADFFVALERLGSIPLAARELGFNLSTCDAWAGPSGRKSGQKYTQAEKDRFFVLLDRLGSVSLAAKTVGINVQTCFHWAYKAGAVTRKPRTNPVAKQSATQEQKDEFFAVLARVGSVSVAARELGLERSRASGGPVMPESGPSTQGWGNAPNSCGCAKRASAGWRPLPPPVRAAKAGTCGRTSGMRPRAAPLAPTPRKYRINRK